MATNILYSIHSAFILLLFFNCVAPSYQHTYCLDLMLAGLHTPVEVVTWEESVIVADHSGRIIVYEKNAHVPQVLLDIKNKIITTEKVYEERGLLGMALSPNLKLHPWIYIHYSGLPCFSSGDHCSILSRFKVETKGNSIHRILKDSEEELLKINQPTARRNGGHVFFGLDGYLYISVGDGGSDDDMNARFNNSSPLGKILRIDVRNPTPEVPYTIPRDNPFVHNPEKLGEIYAAGFRNIWRCSVDHGEFMTGEDMGRVICTDVGKQPRNADEVWIVENGQMYGWTDTITPHCLSTAKCWSIAGPKDPRPVYVFHSDKPHAIVGGIMYRGARYHELTRHYLFAEFVEGSLYTLREAKNEPWIAQQIKLVHDKKVCPNGPQDGPIHINGFSLDSEGYILLLTRERSKARLPGTGAIYRLMSTKFKPHSSSVKSSGNRSVSTSWLIVAPMLFLLRLIARLLL